MSCIFMPHMSPKVCSCDQSEPNHSIFGPYVISIHFYSNSFSLNPTHANPTEMPFVSPCPRVLQKSTFTKITSSLIEIQGQLNLICDLNIILMKYANVGYTSV